MKLIKRGYTMNISEEILFAFNAKYPARKVAYIEELPITDEQRAQHARAVAAVEELGENPYTEWGHEPHGVMPLQPNTVTHYAETHQEWLDRCRALRAESTVEP